MNSDYALEDGTRVDILKMLEMKSNVFYEYAADNGKLLSAAAQEIRELREFRDRAFEAHPNIDLDIERSLRA